MASIHNKKVAQTLKFNIFMISEVYFRWERSRGEIGFS